MRVSKQGGVWQIKEVRWWKMKPVSCPLVNLPALCGVLCCAVSCRAVLLRYYLYCIGCRSAWLTQQQQRQQQRLLLPLKPHPYLVQVVDHPHQHQQQQQVL